MPRSRRRGRPPTAERIAIQERGYRTPCHIWLLGKNKKGYGQEWYCGKMEFAHRAAYHRLHGEVPPELDHLCSQRDCVNPEHLEPVTHTENIRRGRASRLRPVDVLTMKLARTTTTLSGPQIADMLGVTHSAVYKALHGRTWA